MVMTVGPAPGQDFVARLDRVLSSLTNIAMKEQISRFDSERGIPRKLDSFETEVSIAEDTEQYTLVRGAHRTYKHVSEIGGLWSFGELVTMLRTTRDILASAQDQSVSGDGPSEEIHFQSSADSRRWFVQANGRIYWLAFEGMIRISRESGEIERLTWIANENPAETGIGSILWDFNFHTVPVGNVICTMPSDSVYKVVRKGANRKPQWNVTTYSALGRYGATADVSYAQ
jgi:hypothetical protein